MSTTLRTYVMLLGNSGVGKTTMATHLETHTAPALVQTTMNADFKALTVPVGVDGKGPAMQLTLVDAPGPSNFAGLVASYYRGAEAILLLYDVTQRQTFDALKIRWWPEILLRATSLRCVVVVANQCDKTPAAVTPEEGRQFANSINAKGFFTISALNGSLESVMAPLSLALREIVAARKASGEPLPPVAPSSSSSSSPPPIRLGETRQQQANPLLLSQPSNNKACCS